MNSSFFPDSSEGLGVLLGEFKGKQGYTKNNDMQMKHMMDSFEAQKKKMAKK